MQIGMENGFMTRFFRTDLAAAALATVAALGLADVARAGHLIQLSTDGSTFTTIAGNPATEGGTLTPTDGTFNGFAYTGLSSGSNSPGISIPVGGFSQLTSANLSVTNTNGSTATLFVRIVDTGFDTPTAPPDVLFNSFVSGNVTNSVGDIASNAFESRAVIDPSNGQYLDPSNLSTLASSLISPGLQTPNVNVAGSFMNDMTILTGALMPTNPLDGYSVTQLFKVTLGASSQIAFQGNVTLVSVPEPASLAMVGVGLIGIPGVLALRRRRGTTA